MDKLRSILLVDDDEATNFFNQIILEDLNITEHIQVTFDGLQALDYLLKRGEYEAIEDHIFPELIFLDINMPGMNGFDFLEEYHSIFSNKNDTPLVVMLTTSLDEGDKQKVLTYDEVADFINKPLKQEKMRELLYGLFPGRFTPIED